MRIGITGISGYIGRHAAQSLRQAGHEVIGFSRSEKSTGPEGVEEMRKLVTDPNSSEVTDFSRLDGILHLAGEPIFSVWSKKKERRVWSSRVDLTLTIWDHLSKLPENQRPRVFVSASGINYYGDRGDDVLTERNSPEKGRLFPDLVHEWEAAAFRIQRLGPRVVCCRIGVVIGKGSPACSLLKKIFGAGLGGRIGDGKQWVSWVSMTDLSKMFVSAFGDKELRGAVNCCSPNPVQNSELTRLLGKTLHRPTLFPVPPFGLRMVFGPMSAALLDSVRAEPAAWLERGFSFRHPDLESALAEAMR